VSRLRPTWIRSRSAPTALRTNVCASHFIAFTSPRFLFNDVTVPCGTCATGLGQRHKFNFSANRALLRARCPLRIQGTYVSAITTPFPAIRFSRSWAASSARALAQSGTATILSREADPFRVDAHCSHRAWGITSWCGARRRRKRGARVCDAVDGMCIMHTVMPCWPPRRTAPVPRGPAYSTTKLGPNAPLIA
jgi:hypothetical protein